MEFNPYNALLTTFLTVVVAALVAGHQERGKQRFQARREVRDIVTERLQDVVWYQHGIGQLREEAAAGHAAAENGRRTIFGSDEVFAAKVLRASDGLPWWRRRLIRRRLRRLFGEGTVWVASLNRTGEAQESFGLGIALWKERSERGLDGQYRRALLKGSDSKDVQRLVRRLRRLAESR